METVLLPVKVYQLIGVFVFFLIGVTITATIWNLVARKFREKTNRREDKPNGNAHWTVQMILNSERLANRMGDVHTEVKALNTNLMNGLSRDIKEIKAAVSDCREKSGKKV